MVVTRKEQVIDKIKEAINNNDLNSYKEWAEEQIVEYYIIREIIHYISHTGRQLDIFGLEAFEEETLKQTMMEFQVIIDMLTKFSSAKEALYYGYKKGVICFPGIKEV